jgi:2-haloalkanoic acid dehalogenase type II
MTEVLSRYRALSFDCYGTLIDWETGIWDALQPLIAMSGRLDVTRAKGLSVFARHETALQAANPRMRYPVLLAAVHHHLAAELDLPSTVELDTDFGRSVGTWPAFPDTADALRALGRRFRLVILSNVDRQSFSESNRKLGVDFDAVYTAEDIASYKPDPANFRYLATHADRDLGLAPDDLLHTAQSVFHDIVPAGQAGLSTAWIDRQHLESGGGWGATHPVESRPSPDFTFSTLAEMVQAIAIGGRS